jgi:hypothetical protein
LEEKDMISPRNKLRLRKWTLMLLRSIVWAADEWLHRAELRLREDLAASEQKSLRVVPQQRSKRGPEPGVEAEPARESFLQWEARRSGVAPIEKAKRRSRQHRGAADFDRELREHFSRNAS